MTYARSSPEAKSSRKELPPDVLLALPDVMDLLCDEPLRGRALGGDIRVYKHPDPPLQVTYKLDQETDTIEFLDFAARIIRFPRNVFISYSHRDKPWFKMVRKKLDLLEDLGVSLWSDVEIQPAEDWDRLIAERLESSRAALLLVSQPFLESGYVRTKELPAFMAKLDRPSSSFKLLWFLVSQCDLHRDEMGRKIAEKQALLPVDKPLASIKTKKLKGILKRLRRQIARAVAR